MEVSSPEVTSASTDDHERGRMDNAIVTLVIQHHVIAGVEPQYEAWLNEIVPTAQRFAGHLGVNIIRPHGGVGVYTIVLRFDTHGHLRDWVESDTRKRLTEQVASLLVSGERIEIKTGLEYWFTPADSAQKQAKRVKQFLVTLSAIFPLTVIVPRVLRPLFEAVPVLGWPIVSNFVIAVIIVFLMVYLIMPHYTKLISRWLFS